MIISRSSPLDWSTSSKISQANTETASGKPMPCLVRLALALLGSHSNSRLIPDRCYHDHKPGLAVGLTRHRWQEARNRSLAQERQPHERFGKRQTGLGSSKLLHPLVVRIPFRWIL